MRTMQTLNTHSFRIMVAAVIGLSALIGTDLAAAPTVRGPQLVPGLVGKAFLVDSIEHALSFRTGDTFNPACGTVEFWVQPQREIGKEDFEGTLYQTTDSLSATEGVQVLFNGKGIEARTRNASCRAGWGSTQGFPVQFAALMASCRTGLEREDKPILRGRQIGRRVCHEADEELFWPDLRRRRGVSGEGVCFSERV